MTSRLRIGITYDLKADGAADAGLPDDFQEEFDSPVTIEAIAAVLRGLGHVVEKLGTAGSCSNASWPIRRILSSTLPRGTVFPGRVKRGYQPCWKCSAFLTRAPTR